MSTWTKKAMFVGLPRYLEQLLGACYAKEGWELYRFRAVEGERPSQGIHTYDCEVDSAERRHFFYPCVREFLRGIGNNGETFPLPQG